MVFNSFCHKPRAVFAGVLSPSDLSVKPDCTNRCGPAAYGRAGWVLGWPSLTSRLQIHNVAGRPSTCRWPRALRNRRCPPKYAVLPTGYPYCLRLRHLGHSLESTDQSSGLLRGLRSPCGKQQQLQRRRTILINAANNDLFILHNR